MPGTMGQAHDEPDDGMLNLGPVSRKWLEQAGITSERQLHELGAVAAFRRVRLATGMKPTAHLLYALEGAITRTPWTLIPESRRIELRREAGLETA